MEQVLWIINYLYALVIRKIWRGYLKVESPFLTVWMNSLVTMKYISQWMVILPELFHIVWIILVFWRSACSSRVLILTELFLPKIYLSSQLLFTFRQCQIVVVFPDCRSHRRFSREVSDRLTKHIGDELSVCVGDEDGYFRGGGWRNRCGWWWCGWSAWCRWECCLRSNWKE